MLLLWILDLVVGKAWLAHRRTAPLPALGIIIGVWSVVSLMAIGNGAQKARHRWLYTNLGAPPEIIKSKADALGRYALAALEPGTFSLRATADGYEPEVRQVTLASNLIARWFVGLPLLGPTVKSRFVPCACPLPIESV